MTAPGLGMVGAGGTPSGRRRDLPMPRRPCPIRAWQLPEPGPAPAGQAAAIEAALDRELVRRLEAVPLVLPVVERLGLRDRVNERVHPTGDRPADLDLGRVTEVLVFNRLL